MKILFYEENEDKFQRSQMRVVETYPVLIQSSSQLQSLSLQEQL
jgi:hypothetical protein